MVGPIIGLKSYDRRNTKSIKAWKSAAHPGGKIQAKDMDTVSRIFATAERVGKTRASLLPK